MAAASRAIFNVLIVIDGKEEGESAAARRRRAIHCHTIAMTIPHQLVHTYLGTAVQVARMQVA